jgi:rubrerythrin
MSTKDAALKALTQALRLEQEGRAFYLQAAEETIDEKGKAMFQSLADDEAKHADMIQRQLRTIERGGNYLLLPDVNAPDIDLGKKLFPPGAEAARKAADQATNELEVLQMALDNEIRSYDLYRAAAQLTVDEAGRAMYAWLARAEMQHFDLLMANWESLTAMGGWV